MSCCCYLRVCGYVHTQAHTYMQVDALLRSLAARVPNSTPKQLLESVIAQAGLKSFVQALNNGRERSCVHSCTPSCCCALLFSDSMAERNGVFTFLSSWLQLTSNRRMY